MAEQAMQDCEAKVKLLVRERGVFKGKITSALNRLRDLKSQNTLTGTMYKRVKGSIEKLTLDIKSFDDEILNEFHKIDYQTHKPNKYQTELDGQSAYSFDFLFSLEEFIDFDDLNSTAAQNGANVGQDQLALSKLALSQQEPKPPQLKCGLFSGVKNDKLTFANFLRQYNTVVGNKRNISKFGKINFLISHLSGYALQRVSHLEESEENYEEFLEILNEEFLDKPSIIEEIYGKLINSKPEYDEEYGGVKCYINQVKSYLHDLKNLYEKDFLG